MGPKKMALACSYVNTGNRCGHNPKRLREYQPPESNLARPPILEETLRKIVGYYHNSRQLLQDLRETLSGRIHRSEFREDIVAMVQALLHYMHLESMEVCYTQTGEPCSLKFLAKRAQLSLSRAKVAMKYLVEAGYVLTTIRWVRFKEGFKALASIKRISIKLFTHLGITEMRLRAAQAKFRKHQALKQKRQLIEATHQLYESELGAYLNQNTAQVATGAERIQAIMQAFSTDVHTAAKIDALLKKPPD
jgi:hypothetical protein